MNELTIANNAEIVEANANLETLGQRFISFIETDSTATLNTYKASIKRLFAFFHGKGNILENFKMFRPAEAFAHIAEFIDGGHMAIRSGGLRRVRGGRPAAPDRGWRGSRAAWRWRR